MSSKSSGFRVKRSLSFTAQELPYESKTFYIDVKSCSLKAKLSQRILNLGGLIENFLSKDLTLLITDKHGEGNNKVENDSEANPKISTLKPSIPLSRGQALLLKASGQSNPSVNNKNHGLVQSASKLGVKVQTPSQFLHSSSKLLSKVKALAEYSKHEDPLSGMSPISWDDDKENLCVIKVEDEDKLFRPLLKHFDKFPEICYSECGSPFDVGVVLTKHDENQQSKKKTTNGRVQLGGYCESCDHWYKCSLREHLNSDKHKQFTAKVENFESLNQMTLNLPDIQNFVYRLGLKQDNSQKDDTFNVEPSQNYSLTEMQNNTNIISAKIESDEKNIDKKQLKSSETAVRNSVILNSNSISAICLKSDGMNSCSSLPKQSKDSQRYSIDDVLRNITDDIIPVDNQNIDIFNSYHGDNAEPFGLISNVDSQKVSRNTGSNFCRTEGYDLDPGSDVNKGKITTATVTNISFPNINQDTNFSSSSFSFGDNGVNKVLSLLNESDSHNSERFSFNSASNSFSNSNDQTFNCLETLVREKVTDAKSLQNENNEQFQSNYISEVSKCKEDELQQDINVGRSFETDSGLNDDLTVNVSDKKSTVCNQFPEYSNITEDSNQSKPSGAVIQTSNDSNPMSSLNFHCFNFDTELFGKDVTPCKDAMNSLRDNINKENANSGSTIRNWLIPVEDNTSVASPVGLDNTLIEKNVETAVVVETKKLEESNTVDVHASVNDIIETTDTSKVAAWIQSNIFDTDIDINIERNIEDSAVDDKCAKMVDKLNDDIKINDDIGMDESCSIRKYGTNHSVESNSNSAWSDSGTSISDCTLPDFRGSASRDNTIMIDGSLLSVSHKQHLDGKDSDNVSVKSSLSSSITARGIKISGLSTLKNGSSKTSSFVQSCENLHPSDRNDVITDNSTMVQDCMNSWSLYNDNTILPNNCDAVNQPSISKQSEYIPVAQNIIQNAYNPSVTVTSDQNLCEDIGKGSDVNNKSHVDNKTKGRKSNVKKQTKTSSKRKGKPSAVTNTVLPNNANAVNYSNGHHNKQFQPIGSTFQSPNVNFTAQVNSINSDPRLVNQFGLSSYKSINMQYYPAENRNSPSAQSYNSSMFSPGSHGNSMMDLLLSPGFHSPSNHSQVQVSDKQSANQQLGYQATNYCSNVYTNPQVSSSNMNVPVYELNSQQCTTRGINQTIPSVPSQYSNVISYSNQQSSAQSNVSNSVTINPWNTSATLQQSMYLSPKPSIQEGHLQTIDLSHIAEGNATDYSYNYNISQPKYRQTNVKKTKASSRKQSVKESTCLSTRNVEQCSSPVIYNQVNSNPMNIRSPSMSSASMMIQNLPQNASFSTHNQSNQWKQNYDPQMPAKQCFSPYDSNFVTPFNNGYSSNQQQYQQIQNNVTLHNGGSGYGTLHNGGSGYGTLHNGGSCNETLHNGGSCNETLHNGGSGNSSIVYNTVQTGDMKLTFRKVPVIEHKPQQSRHDLMHYWNVRKAGDCRLVFSNNMSGKRKAEETPTKYSFIEDSSSSMSQPLSKRQRCLIY